MQAAMLLSMAVFFIPKMFKKNLILLLSIFGLVLSNAAAQVNLVPNPSFELLVGCPDLGGQIFFAEPWFSATTTGTPDLFNACSSELTMGVPYNRSGKYYQPSRTGNGYAGILVYNHHGNPGTREYIETPLIQNLKDGEQYYMRFFVSASNSLFKVAPCYCDGIGATFTNSKYENNTGNLPVLTDLKPAIDNTGKILSDTVNWTSVSGCFNNIGETKNFLIIGNFRDNANTLASLGCDLTFPNNSYLYIEDVGVWEFNPLPDTLLLCKGESKIVNASFLEARYAWSDGTTDSTFRIATDGIYSVSADMGDCVLSDTVVVIMMEGVANTPTDTLICQAEKVILLAPAPGDYAWSTGSNSAEIEIIEAGIYTLTVTNTCGTFLYENRVETEVCDCPIYVPNIFSPDGDGLNDELMAFSACDFPLSIKRFQVFDRWGNLVYASVSDAIENIRWDGFTQGKPASSGVYVWSMEYTIAPKGQPEQKILQGDITILR